MSDDPSDILADIDLAAAIAATIQFDAHIANVTVDVWNGVVTLEGEVGSHEERDAAESLVRAFDVKGVVNAVVVKQQHTA